MIQHLKEHWLMYLIILGVSLLLGVTKSQPVMINWKNCTLTPHNGLTDISCSLKP